MISAKILSAGPDSNKRLEGSAVAIYSSTGDPIVLVVETAPGMQVLYSAAADGDEFIEKMRKYDRHLRITIDQFKAQ